MPRNFTFRARFGSVRAVGRACWLVVMFVVFGCRAGNAGNAGNAGSTDATTDATDATISDVSVVEVVTDAAPAACALLSSGCAAGTYCYPFPFAEMATGEARCAAYQPPAGPSPQCDSEVQCPGGTVCATLFGISTDCHRLCNIDLPACGDGMECIPLAGYPRAGLCL